MCHMKLRDSFTDNPWLFYSSLKKNSPFWLSIKKQILWFEVNEWRSTFNQVQSKQSVLAGRWIYKGSRILSHDQSWAWCMWRRWMDAGHEDRRHKGIKSVLRSFNVCHHLVHNKKVNLQCKSRVHDKWKKGNLLSVGLQRFTSIYCK